MTERRRFNCGIMCNGPSLRGWQAECVNELLRSNLVDLKLLIVNANPRQKTSTIQKLRRANLFTFFNVVSARKGTAQKDAPTVPELSNVSKLHCVTEQRGKYSQYFSDDDLLTIKTYGLDFILKFSFGIIRGDILTVAKLGVWSFHHDDEQNYRGGPPGFWEIYFDDPITGAILQRLTESLDAGVVLYKGYFDTNFYSWSANYDRVLWASSQWPAQVCRRILAGYQEPTEPSQTNAPIYKRPNNRQTIVFLLRLLRNNTWRRAKKLATREAWNIGLAKKNYADLIAGNQLSVSWFPRPTRHEFFADGFGASENGEMYILFERYIYSQNRGQIACLTLDKNLRPKQISKTSIAKNSHFSYPFLFKHEDCWYCIPETSHANAVSLYRAKQLPETWEKIADIIPDYSGVDSTLYFHQGFFWIFCTTKKEPNVELHIWWAKNLKGPWQQHLCNPVKCDIRSARPAGPLFEHKGVLYRPAQDSSLTYGARLAINRVHELTPGRFNETVETWIEPDRSGYYKDGLHTISKIGDYFLVDGKREVLSPISAIRRISRRLS